jgi:hypothetical protein
MAVTNISPIAKYAFSWADLHSEVNHLENLFRNGKLNEEQMDFINEYILHVNEKIEDLECYLLEADESGKFYNEVRQAANMLSVKPSEGFISHLESKLSEMKLDGLEYQIKQAVEKFNSFYYSCAIYINSFGCVGFNGCQMDSNGSATVLFNKTDKNKLTIEDVKRKISNLTTF